MSHTKATSPATGPPLRPALVVDDEALIRWSVSETLADHGLAVSQAADGASAISAITEAAVPFEVVVLDLRLPDVDDLSLLHRVRDLLPAATIVLMTALGTSEIVNDALALGVTGVLNKPFELTELVHLLASAGDASVS
jgi:DNA-binding NtrC family response regulator